MAKIVYNSCYVGFSCNKAVRAKYKQIAAVDPPADYDIARDDPVLVRVVEELGEAANSRFANLAIKYVPKGSMWRIDEYDGTETVMTKEDYEWNIAKD